MIDPKLLRSDPEAVARNLARRGFALDVGALRALEEGRKHWQMEADRLRADRNAKAKSVGMAKAKGEDIAPLLAQGDALAAQLADAEKQFQVFQEQLDTTHLGLPNLLNDSVPDGADETANVELRRWGRVPSFDFTPRDHVELGELLRGMDFEAGTRIAGSRFVVLRADIARLHREIGRAHV